MRRTAIRDLERRVDRALGDKARRIPPTYRYVEAGRWRAEALPEAPEVVEFEVQVTRETVRP